MALWFSLKRNKVYVDIFYKGEKIATLKVSEQNRSNYSVIEIDKSHDTKFVLVKDGVNSEKENNSEENENIFNKEIYNK